MEMEIIKIMVINMTYMEMVCMELDMVKVMEKI